jgi:hypothetical protein
MCEPQPPWKKNVALSATSADNLTQAECAGMVDIGDLAGELKISAGFRLISQPTHLMTADRTKQVALHYVMSAIVALL